MQDGWRALGPVKCANWHFLGFPAAVIAESCNVLSLTAGRLGYCPKAGAAIRDQLRMATSGSGQLVGAGPAEVSRALEILARRGEVNHRGASTTLEWDENGDLLRGHVGVWRFTKDGKIEDVKIVPFGG